MKVAKRFSDISDFTVDGAKFAVKRNGKNLALINTALDEVYNIELKENVQEIYYSQHSVFTNTLMDGYGVIVHDDGKTEYLDYFIKFITDNGDIIGTDNESGFRIKADGTKQWFVDDIFFHLYANREFVLYKKGKNLLICLDNNSGNILWRYQLPHIEVCYDGTPVQDISISKILGYHTGIIWIVLNTGNILGISVGDGMLKHHCSLPVNWPEEWKSIEYFGNAEKSVLDETGGKIFGIGGTMYWEIDLTDPESSYTCFDINDTLLAHNIKVSLAGEPLCWQADEILIGQQAFAQQPSYVGIFNRKTREFTWTSHEMGEEGVFPGLRKVGMAGKRLLVLDAAGTLHVLERE